MQVGDIVHLVVQPDGKHVAYLKNGVVVRFSPATGKVYSAHDLPDQASIEKALGRALPGPTTYGSGKVQR
jgi:hypothetical protein